MRHFHKGFVLTLLLLLQGFQGLAAAQMATAKRYVPNRQAVPAVVAKRVIVVDNRSGAVLYEKNSKKRCAVASTQKLLTALCVMDAGSLDHVVKIQSTDTKVVPMKLYIRTGERYKRSELLKALLVRSGNDVAKALARDVAGSQKAFSVVMNRKARSLGMRDSHFVNAHGLTESGQYSTARDMAIAARAVWRQPVLRSFMATKGYYFERPKSKKRWINNTNKLLKKLSFCTGGKTGTTKASGKCLVSFGEHQGREVIIVCLGSTNKDIWDDTEHLMRWALGVPAEVS